MISALLRYLFTRSYYTSLCYAHATIRTESTVCSVPAKIRRIHLSCQLHCQTVFLGYIGYSGTHQLATQANSARPKTKQPQRNVPSEASTQPPDNPKNEEIYRELLLTYVPYRTVFVLCSMFDFPYHISTHSTMFDFALLRTNPLPVSLPSSTHHHTSVHSLVSCSMSVSCASLDFPYTYYLSSSAFTGPLPYYPCFSSNRLGMFQRCAYLCRVLHIRTTT